MHLSSVNQANWELRNLILGHFWVTSSSASHFDPSPPCLPQQAAPITSKMAAHGHRPFLPAHIPSPASFYLLSDQIQTPLFPEFGSKAHRSHFLQVPARFNLLDGRFRMVEWRVAAMLGTGLSGRGDASRATEAHHRATTPPVDGAAQLLFYKP